jgi:outer membrane receptor protein involved in Fe transport
MTPFEVQTSAKDIGYYAQNTLAGSRLNSKLDDLGASITVVTKQQMIDTSSIDLNDMFLYEASTEGTENYTQLGATAKGSGVGDAVQTSPQTSTRIRGLGAPDITRDFYVTNPAIQVDAYNIDRVEISRGPNSTLFGIGSPSGVVNESIEEAVLNKDTNEIGLRYGRFGDERGTINLNRALITDKLSIAVAGLYQNTHRTDQQPVYDIQRREFAAMTLKPVPKMTIKANIEFYDNPNRRADSITPTDEISPWIAAGSPSWDPITHTATVNGVTGAPVTATANLPAGLIGSLGNFNITAPAIYVVNGQVQLWEQQVLGTNFNAPGTPTTPVSATNPFGPIGQEFMAQSAGNYAKYASSAPAGQVTYPLFKEPSVSNNSLLNYQKINTRSDSLGEDKAQIYNVEIQQEIVENLFLDAGWYREQFTSSQHN